MIQNFFTYSKIIALLKKLKVVPKKKLGQNYLIDYNIINKSLTFADIKSDEAIIEVGPGLGSLTSPLLQSGAHVWAVEIDPILIKHLRHTLLVEFPLTFHLIEADAVLMPLANFLGDNRFKIVANLPYAIKIPWLEKILTNSILPEAMVLMVQKEVGEKLIAQSGKKTFCAMSIFLQSMYKLGPTHLVSPKCFYPIPGVKSMILTLRKKNNPYQFQKITRNCIRGFFTKRRKQIGSLCRKHPNEFKLKNWLKYLNNQNISHFTRPEAIEILHWKALDKILNS